ncbi:hypothetical protein FRC06_001285 [Ceratobasidium sp. 370]|nr:hypothetical protein FRC06_001285 [Ceratobasidium sp. 370]
MTLSPQQPEPPQHPSPPVAQYSSRSHKITPRPGEATPPLKFVSRDADDSSSSTNDEEWPEPVSRTHDWVSLVQHSKGSIAALSCSDMGYCLPPRFIPNPSISGMTVRFIMSQYEPLFELAFFKPVRVHMEFIRGRFIARIISSSITHWSMYLGARIFQALHQDGDHANVRGYIPWLDRFDRLCVTSNNDNSLDDLIGRLSGALELTFLKYITSNTNSGYALMRRMAPTFMKIAFADPSLWPRHPSSNGISLAHVLVSPQHELGRFVFGDAISSLTFGTPPLVEYDTTHPAIQTRQAHPMEWVHGCPAEFAFLIVKINPTIDLSPYYQITAQPYESTSGPSPISRSPGDTHSSYEGELSEQASHTDTQVPSAWRVATAPALDMGYRLPPKFIPNPSVSGVTIRFIMSQYEPVFELIVFKPVRINMDFIRGDFISRLNSSSVTRWSMYLGAQIFQSIRKDGEHANVHRYTPWLDQFGQFCVAPSNDNSLEDLTSRLSGGMELTFLKYITSNANSAYNLMRRIAPVFMHVASADPSLWPRHPSSSGISLAHVLISHQYELTRFVFVETIMSLSFGIPPLVEYDTSHPVIQTPEVHPTEWVHGCPTAFAYSIIKINTWRAQNPGGRAEPDTWQEIEAATWAWRSKCDYGPDPESWRIVARADTKHLGHPQGMCGLNSHDPRVQSSTRQIGRLYDTIKANISVGIHFLVPLLLAAICTRSEIERSRLRKVIAQPNDKAWLLKGVEFESVLDHLWHGAAADGAPITWDDYVNSRKATIHIDT